MDSASARSKASFARPMAMVVAFSEGFFGGGGGAVFNQHGFPVSQDRRTFVIINGPTTPVLPEESLHIVDIAATALFHLGISTEEIAMLDGQPVGIWGAGEYEPREIPSCYDPSIMVP